MHDIRSDFPVFTAHPELIYLDSTSTTQKPAIVIDRQAEYLRTNYANIHRGAYDLSTRSEELYTESKRAVAELVGAVSQSEIIYTSNSTAAANLLTLSLTRSGWIERGDRIILSILEHHANIVPWQIAADTLGLEIVWVPITPEYQLDMEVFSELLTPNTRVVSITGASNVTGTLPDWTAIRDLVRTRETLNARKIYLVMDASQVVPHTRLDVQTLDLDFMFFTGHKLYADSGIGILYGKRDLLKSMTPGISGGWAINSVSETGFEPAGLPFRFEAGTPNMSGAVSLLTAIEYIHSVWGYEMITEHEKAITDMFLRGFAKLGDRVRVIWGVGSERAPVFSFVVPGRHSNDIADELAQASICVRAGHHCTEPLHTRLGISGSVRASAWIYTTSEEVEKFFQILEEIII